jgi:hypothetical protein
LGGFYYRYRLLLVHHRLLDAILPFIKAHILLNFILSY